MPYVARWTDLVRRSLTRVTPARGLFVGYNACIDFLEYLEPFSLERIYREHMTEPLFRRIQKHEIPKVLESREDFLVALASCAII